MAISVAQHANVGADFARRVGQLVFAGERALQSLSPRPLSSTRLTRFRQSDA